jgi:hypothetical protein
VDFEYLSRRYEDELKHASEADSDAAREAHLALANQYLAKIEQLKGRDGAGPQLATQ